MQDVEKLLKGTVEELDKLLNARNVLGEPIDREGATVIPIVSYGFGFGAAGGEDAKSGGGAGTGAGGGIKPVGAIVFDGDGARVEAIKGTVSNVAEILVDAASKVAGSKPSGQGKASTET